MTAQGKPDRCPRCGSANRALYYMSSYAEGCTPDNRDRWHDFSPVPAAAPTHDSTHFCDKHPGWRYPCVQCAKPSAPQAESVPSGEDAARVHVIQRMCGKCGHEMCECIWNQTAALAAERDKYKAFNEAHLKIARDERERLREQLISATKQNATLMDTNYELRHRDTSRCSFCQELQGHSAECWTVKVLNECAELRHSNSLLRERITAAEWIPVEDRMPEADAWVLTTDGDHWEVCNFHNGREAKFWTAMHIHPITHWMPLPERPKNISEHKENQ